MRTIERRARPCRRARHAQRGFTYVGLLILVAVLGLVAALTIRVGALWQRAAREAQLLEIGAQFSDALRAYADATPAGQLPQPPNLAALLLDPRFPTPHRYLRKIFADPITGSTDWGITYVTTNKGVLEVYSRSSATPLKAGHFDEQFGTFGGKTHYYDWRFSAATATPVVLPSTPTPGSGPGTPVDDSMNNPFGNAFGGPQSPSNVSNSPNANVGNTALGGNNFGSSFNSPQNNSFGSAPENPSGNASAGSPPSASPFSSSPAPQSKTDF
ncbi:MULTISPECIES: type II secretion system protein [Pandoraea]|uniref:type II secretion system protein n=1 Tax=Pandoraea TaxID=93217 RepID=UPI001F5CABF7|nr:MULTISPECIES: type II secretion system protein [Pandoraea]